MFKIGQEVVCVKDDEWPQQVVWQTHILKPKAGRVYTVRGVCIETGGITVEEIVNREYDCKQGRHEPHFLSWRFRPLIQRKTDISALEALLNPLNHKVLEDA